MKKAIALVIAALLCVGCSGDFDAVFLNGKAEPEYLTDEEARLRPLYQQLNDEEKQVYTAVYRGICMHQESVDLPMQISGDLYSKIYFLIEKQESGLYYIDSSYYTAEKMKTAKIIYRDNAFQSNNELKTAAQEVLIDPATEDFEKVLLIHDFLIGNCRYVLDEGGYNGTSFGCLAEGEAQCEGYAKAFDYLAKTFGLCDIVVTGMTNDGESHAWNQVKIDGEWYNLDVTWDDTDIEGECSHAYMLCSDEEFSKTHLPDTSYFQPFQCLSEKSYYVRCDLLIENLDDAERILDREMQQGKNLIELKFKNDAAYNEFEQVFLENQKIFELMQENELPCETEYRVNVKGALEELRILISW